MEYLILIGSGVLIGLIVAAPIGPVNLICIRRTLMFSTLTGFLSGIGAALGDGVFAAITGFGLTYISQIIRGYSHWLQLVGGTMLLIFGIQTYLTRHTRRERAQMKKVEKSPSSLIRSMVSTFALTITNPATLLGFAALFAGLGGFANGQPSFHQAAPVVGGVVLGSTLWWFTLTTVVGLFHKSITEKVMVRINHLSGIAIALFGLAVLGHIAIDKLIG